MEEFDDDGMYGGDKGGESKKSSRSEWSLKDNGCQESKFIVFIVTNIPKGFSGFRLVFRLVWGGFCFYSFGIFKIHADRPFLLLILGFALSAFFFSIILGEKHKSPQKSKPSMRRVLSMSLSLSSMHHQFSI